MNNLKQNRFYFILGKYCLISTHMECNLFIANAGILAANDIEKIRKELTEILGRFFDQLRIWLTSLSKLLYLTIFLLVFDALNYMRLYYSNDAFDNASIDGNITRIWQKNGKVSLAPFRHWELKEKYQYATSAKLSGQEIKSIISNSIPTVIATTGIMAIRFSDLGFYKVCMLKNIKKDLTFLRSKFILK